MNRRRFLTWQMQGLLLTAAGSLALPRAVLSAPAAPDVAVVKGAPAAAARAAVELLGGMGRFVRPGQRVVIKPNMSFARPPEAATNTHPEVVRAVAAMCLEAGAGSVRVLDNPLQDATLALQRSGILDACESLGRGLCHQLSDTSFYQDADIAQGASLRGNAFMRDVLEADVIIAVPVAKSHSGAGVSLSLKGQMGLVLDRHTMHARGLDACIVDLNTRIRPHLAVIDATRVLTTGGPGGPGKVITPGEVIASADPVAADAMAVASYEWYGRSFKPSQVGHIRLAHERGLGRMDIDNLDCRRVAV